MDIVLKEADIIRLLGTAMDLSLSPEDVSIQESPLTITIANAENYFAKRAEALPRTNVPPVEEDETPPGSEPLLSMEDLVRINAGLAAEPPKIATEPRRLGRNESYDPPPPSERGAER